METVFVYSGAKDSGPIVLSSTLAHNSLHIKPMNAPTSAPLLCGQKSRAGVTDGSGDGAITEGDGDKHQVCVIASSSPLIASKV